MPDQTALVPAKPKLLEVFANRHGLEAEKVLGMLTETAFNQGKDSPLTQSETQAALVICNTYDLNPMLREIFVFRSKGKLLVYVPVDGWATIINRQAAFDGMEFEEYFDGDGKIQSVTCTMYRKDRSRPTSVTEYTHECKRDSEPWNKMPIRMTRNRAMIQCARIAFSISGIVDDDEAQTIEGFTPPAGPRSPQEEELERYMEGSNWSAQKRRSFREQYAGRVEDAISYLKSETAKHSKAVPSKKAAEGGAVVVQPTEKTQEQQPAQESKPAQVQNAETQGGQPNDFWQ